MRISRLATFVEVIARPFQFEPLGIDVSFIQSARMRGGSSGAATKGVGQGFGDETTLRGSMKLPVYDEEHAEMNTTAAAASRREAIAVTGAISFRSEASSA